MEINLSDSEVELIDVIIDVIIDKGYVVSNVPSELNKKGYNISSDDFTFLCEQIKDLNITTYEFNHTTNRFTLKKKTETERFKSEGGFRNHFEIKNKETQEIEVTKSLEREKLKWDLFKVKYWWIISIVSAIIGYSISLILSKL
jgi:hypothetical protein